MKEREGKKPFLPFSSSSCPQVAVVSRRKWREGRERARRDCVLPLPPRPACKAKEEGEEERKRTKLGSD